MKYVTRVVRIALGAIVLSSSIAVADNCKIVRGTISALEPVLPPEVCPSLLGCFKGTFSGDLTGTFQSVLTGLTPGDGVVSFTAGTTLETHAPNGALTTSDVGTGIGCFLLPNNQIVCPDSTEVLTITSGVRAYKQVYGSINLWGPYLYGKPGAYQGLICHGKGGK